MVTFISFLLLLAGGVNWFSIGFLQYDFIAGIFGTQASLFSRIFYILIGIGTFWIIIMTIKYRGSVDILNPRFKKAVKKSHVLDEEQDYKR